jgi:NACalpha-BTF3-like transcription factor
VVGKSVSLQSALIELEFEQRKDAANTILKVNSIVSKMMGKYTRKVGDEYIKNLLGSLIDELNGAKDLKLEINPVQLKVENPEEAAKENLIKLTEWCQKIVDRIFDEKLVEETPRELRAICYYISANGDKLGLTPEVLLPMIAGFIILRYICPGISTPNNVGILKDVPSEEVRSNLTILAKVFQKLGNLETFGEDAKAMMPINEWIEANKEKCVTYLAQIIKDPKGENFEDLKKPEEKEVKIEDFPMDDVKLVFKIMKDNNKKFMKELGEEKGAIVAKLIE